MKWYIKLALGVLTGLLLSLAWYVRGAALIILVAFVPLLWLSDISLKEGKRNAFGRGILLFYPAFFIFNLITTYWIAYCTVPGAAAAVILNALLQTLVFAAWHDLHEHSSCADDVRFLAFVPFMAIDSAKERVLCERMIL